MDNILFLIVKLINIYKMIILARIILSWVKLNPYNPIIKFICQITDPLLDAIRRSFPFLVAGGLDLSPIVVFFLLQTTQEAIARIALRF